MPDKPPLIYRLKVTLRDVTPPVWRRLLMPGDVSLSRLHDILQAALGWTDSHLHQFVVGAACYMIPDPDEGFIGEDDKDERRARLSSIAKAPKKRFRYEYDFGDGWEHDILVEKIEAARPGTSYPACVAGARACPPEDCGGPFGYMEMIEILGRPRHPQHRELKEWVGGEWDAEAFDLDEINAALKPPRSAARRGKARGDGD